MLTSSWRKRMDIEALAILICGIMIGLNIGVSICG